MSTPTHDRDATRPVTAFIPPPRRPADPPVQAAVRPEAGEREGDGGERAGILARHAWLIPAIGIASIITIFTAMILLTWAAGGITPFNR
jgi:hypothetical protein